MFSLSFLLVIGSAAGFHFNRHYIFSVFIRRHSFHVVIFDSLAFAWSIYINTPHITAHFRPRDIEALLAVLGCQPDRAEQRGRLFSSLLRASQFLHRMQHFSSSFSHSEFSSQMQRYVRELKTLESPSLLFLSSLQLGFLLHFSSSLQICFFCTAISSEL